MHEMLHYAHGTVELDPVVLHMDVDDKLLERINQRLKALHPTKTTLTAFSARSTPRHSLAHRAGGALLDAKLSQQTGTAIA